MFISKTGVLKNFKFLAGKKEPCKPLLNIAAKEDLEIASNLYQNYIRITLATRRNFVSEVVRSELGRDVPGVAESVYKKMYSSPSSKSSTIAII